MNTPRAEGAVSKAALAVTIVGMLAVGFTTWGILFNTVLNNGRNIERIEQKFDTALAAERLKFEDAKAHSEKDRENLWVSVHAHDLLLQTLQSGTEAMTDLKKQILAQEDRREQRFQETSKSNEQQLIQLHDISNDLNRVASTMQQVVVCLNQEGGCKRLGMPLPYSGPPSR